MKIALVALGNEESYGLLFVGGEWKRLGHEIRFFDGEETDAARRVAAWRPDVVCLSPLTTFYPAALSIARAVKRDVPACVTAFGGHHLAARPVLEPGIDVAVVGPVRGAADKIAGGERGLMRTDLTTPADLPRPAREEYYRDVPRMATRYRKFMLSVPGCPWNCSYCSSAASHIRDRFGADAFRRYYLGRRPLEAVFEEAREIIRYPTREIEWVDDDVLAGADVEEWIPEFAARWQREIGLPLYVSTTSVMALRVSDKVLQALKPCVRVAGMGVQAVRPASLALLNRAWDREPQMKEAYDRLRSFGYAVNLQAIVGLPVADPVEDAMETVKGLQRIGPGSVCSVYPLIVYPGTAMEAHCRRNGIGLNEACGGDTNAGLPHVLFPARETRQIRNICKLATLFVKCGVDERWMRALIDVDFDDETSRRLSLARYHDCVVDRLQEQGETIFDEILAGMVLRY